MRTVTALATAAAVMLLAACATPVAVDPASSPTGSPTASVPAEPVAALLELGPERLRVLDVDGVELATIGYTDPIDPTVAALTEAFGAEPTETHLDPEPCQCDVPQVHVSYDWDGFVLELFGDDGDLGDDSRRTRQYTATAAEVHGISIATPAGIRAGDTADSALALFPQEMLGDTSTGYYPKFDAYTREAPADSGYTGPITDTVFGLVTPDGVLEWLRATGGDYGA